MLLATDGTQTVSIFIYHDIRWGYEAQAGFNAGDGQNSFVLSEALTEQTRYLDQRSNVGEPGVFVYRIDGKTLIIDNSSFHKSICCEHSQQLIMTI